MAAGIIQQQVTTKSGVTINLSFWVDNTSSPTVWMPVNALLDQAGAEILGRTTDAKSSSTDATSISLMAVAKELSDRLQAIAGGIITTGTPGAPAAAGLTIQPYFSDRTKTLDQYTSITNTAETTIITGVASEYHDLCGLLIFNSHASQAANCIIRKTTGGSAVGGPIPVPALGQGGLIISPFSPWRADAQNHNWTLQADAAATLGVTAFYIKN